MKHSIVKVVNSLFNVTAKDIQRGLLNFTSTVVADQADKASQSRSLKKTFKEAFMLVDGITA